MARIRSKNTAPEMYVRSVVHRLGYRFRIHAANLPGKPDLVLSRHRKIILVEGCFWHGHHCVLASKPKTNSRFWAEKIQMNRARDRRNLRALRKLGWTVLRIWECDIRKKRGIEDTLKAFMES